MKIDKTTLRRIIAEERAKLVREQAGGSAGAEVQAFSDNPTELEMELAGMLGDFLVEVVNRQTYDGTGPTWPDEVVNAGAEFEQALVDSGVLKDVITLFGDVEDALHNGEYAF